MAGFNYNGSRRVLKDWIMTNLPDFFTDNNVYIYAPNPESLEYPAAVIRNARATPTAPSIVIVQYEMGILFVVRENDARVSAEKLDTILQEFDNAWVDDSKILSSAYGDFNRKTQENLPTEFDPALEDKLGLITYAASKTVRLFERVQARQV